VLQQVAETVPRSKSPTCALPPLPLPPQLKSKLQQMYPGKYVDPTSTFINRWAQDPFALGSYSFNGMGSKPADRATLAAREDMLFWAGEHAHRNLWATVHGAYLSGKDAAAALLSCRTTGCA
jgi:monoamine oxidase